LIERILAAATRPNDSVFDPFLGSGTTALACANLGRRCVGIEMDPGFLNLAISRLQDPRLQLKIPA
jgi:DNA modification methylase